MWFWQDPREFALWKKLNTLTPAQRQLPKWREICRDVVRRYGNIYFYRPFPKQEAVHRDTGSYMFIHGDNSSGKSYCACAEVAYEVMGWSPFKRIKKPKYGNKLIWIFTPSFAIQRASSQSLLFSTESEIDIGLLPRLETIKELGGKVMWQKQEDSALDTVVFPDGTRIEFKSAEQKSLTVAAAGVDVVFADEVIPKELYNESVARIIRKDGRFLMSFILNDTFEHYVVRELYQNYLQDMAERGKSNMSFHFMSIEDNLSLDASTIEEKKRQVTEDERVWRFGGGRFVAHVSGMRVYEAFDEKVHVKDNLIKTCDPSKTLWRAWDLGRVRPVCIGGQLDRSGRLKVFFSYMGHKVQLVDFIDEVTTYTQEILPRCHLIFDILPHDAKRGTELSRTYVTSETIFKERGCTTEVVYINRERTIDLANEQLRISKGGVPLVVFDSKHTQPLIACLQNYVRDSKGKLRTDGYYEHLSDAFKLLIAFVRNALYDTYDMRDDTPTYFSQALE